MPAPDPQDRRLRGRVRGDVERDLLAAAVITQPADVSLERVRSWRRSWFTRARHVALLDALQAGVRDRGVLARRLGMTQGRFVGWLSDAFVSVVADDEALLGVWDEPACVACGGLATRRLGGDPMCGPCAAGLVEWAAARDAPGQA